jgi:exosome complex component RRP43
LRVSFFCSSSGALDLSDLCIVTGASSWVIYADLMCLNFDGNLADCALLALMQALRRLRLPDTEVVEDAGPSGGGRGAGKGGVAHSEVCISSTSSRPLPPKRTLLPTSFGVMEGQVLADCTGAEEELLSATLTVVVDQSGALVQLHKPGGVPLDDAQLNACIAVAQARVPVLLPLLK